MIPKATTSAPRDSDATEALNRIREIMRESLTPDDFAIIYPIIKAAHQLRNHYVQRPMDHPSGVLLQARNRKYLTRLRYALANIYNTGQYDPF